MRRQADVLGLDLRLPIHRGRVTHVDSDPLDLTTILARALRRGGSLRSVRAAFADIVAQPERFQIKRLESIFASVDKLDLLLDLLFAYSETLFRQLSLISDAARIATELNRWSEFREKISELDVDRGVRWTNLEYLRNLIGRSRNRELERILRTVKYSGAAATWKANAELFRHAERFAQRIDFEGPLLDILYAHSRVGMPRPEWEKHIKAACALDHIISDIKWKSADGLISEFVDERACRSALEQLASSGGTLLLTFHGGHKKMRLGFFEKLFTEGIIMTKRSARPKSSRIAVSEDANTALFGALRALQDGKLVGVAPDAHTGSRHSPIQVLGVEWRFADGAVFLAYESRCQTAWYNVVRQGNGFVPIVRLGPKRLPKESYNEFKTRLLSFFTEELEALLAGDPRDIVLRGTWAEALTGERSVVSDEE